MKKTRFISVFLALAMLFSMMASTTAYAAESSILGAQDNSDFESINAAAALLVDANTDTILYEQNGYEERAMASTTKLMTALLVFDAIAAGQLSMDQEITAGSDAWEGLSSDSSTQNITEGEVMTVENLLYCLLMASANEAANILASTVAGSIDDFVLMMNQKAAELGCTDTHYTNPHGLDDDAHYTTAYDLYLVTKAGWQYEDFQIIVGTDEYYVPATNLSDQRHFYNSNLLLSEKKTIGYAYDYCIGGKTGTTSNAGSCLVSMAEYEGRLLFSIILGAQDSVAEDGTVTRTIYVESRRLLRHGFLDFTTLTVASASDLVAQVPVTMGSDTDYVLVSPAQDVSLDLVYGLTADDFEKSVELPESVEAPIDAGDVIGTMTISYNGTAYTTVNLVAASSVTVSPVQYVKDSVVEFLTRPVVMLVIILVLLLILILLVRRIFFYNPNKKKQKGKKQDQYKGGKRVR